MRGDKLVTNTALISRKLLFGDPTRTAPRLSRDGRFLSYLAPAGGVLNVWVAPIGDLSKARPITNDRKRGIRIYFWAMDVGTILYLQDAEGDENWQLYAADPVSAQVRRLSPVDGVQARVQHVSPEVPDEILVGLNNRKPEYHDLYRVSIATGKSTLIQQNDDFAGFVTDDALNIRFAHRMTPDGGRETLQPGGDGKWVSFETVPAEDALTTYPVGFDKAGSTLYVIDSRGRNTGALFAHDLKTGHRQLLAEDGLTDAGWVVRHPTLKHVQAVAFIYERSSWKILDPDIGPDFEYLGTVSSGDFHIESRSLDDRLWVVGYEIDSGPARYYLYDRTTRQATFLFTTRPELEALPLAEMQPVVIRTRDGLELVSYLTLPVGSGADRSGRPDNPLPTVLFVHGGPWGRDYWGFHPYHQWLANRGYAVLSVNFRGSTGFGKGFVNAANFEWGRKMHDDLVDAVDWAVNERIADPQRVAVMGGSYGGYATLAGLTFTPELFTCGVDIVGPSNLITLLESVPPYWKPVIDMFKTRVGDHTTPEGRKALAERSPLNYVDRIRRPLLIAQGKNDPRVKRTESDQVVEAMQGRGIPVTYILYPDEGHGFARPENSLSFSAVAEAFLASCLGGRFEPVGDDFKGSTITAITGAEYVPGLRQALSG